MVKSWLNFGLMIGNLSQYLIFWCPITVEVFNQSDDAAMIISSKKLESIKSNKQNTLNCRKIWGNNGWINVISRTINTKLILEAIYSRQKVDQYVTNFYMFALDVTIPISFFNVPDCVFDNEVAEYWDNFMTILR